MTLPNPNGCAPLAPVLSTKARTLASLAGRVNTGRVLPLAWFTEEQWRANRQSWLDQLHSQFDEMPLIVRSSALTEDSAVASLAGHFKSIPGVRGAVALQDAIENVIDSYHGSANPKNEVLVQPMLTGVRVSGVVCSHDPGTTAPYRVINDALGTDTEAVTAGTSPVRTFVCAANIPGLPRDVVVVLALVDELQAFFPDRPLDIEFAIAEPDDTLYLLQVRPLILRSDTASREQHHSLLNRVSEKINLAQQPHPYLHGRSTVFGVMPDWNPAEIVGIRPRPLALSLYRELVTDAIWAYQRHNYGYRNLRSFPLLVHFAGQPYIDVRVSFNSFIPRDIEGGLADRLVDYYIARLIAAPNLHDKVEFEIVHSCYTLDLPQRLQRLEAHGFSRHDCSQLTVSLRALTNRIIDRDNGLWRADADKLGELQARRERLLASSLDPLSRIYWLLEDCKRYGTLPFAGLARAGFIAVQMLKSLVAVGVFSQDDYERFMGGLDTVSSQLARDMGTLDRASFLSRYGHLRPGTYDILSPRYDEAPDIYLGNQRKSGESLRNRPPFTLSLPQMRDVARLLTEHGLSSDVVGLFEFLQAGIELREYAKFVFTRNLSDAISLFREWGSQFGFSTEELSYANIASIGELYAGADDPRVVLSHSIEEGKKRFAETSQLWLPPLITRPEDVWAFEMPLGEPNFVTQGSATGPVVVPEDRERLSGGIIFIRSADPGFDWLFSHPIAGLVTAYGGVNSHMAIRANELGLPAVIGAGEMLYGQWSGARQLRIDCSARRVEVIS